MGLMQRNKGKVGERELAKELSRLLGVEARRGQQYAGGDGSPDVVTSIAGVHIECKRTNHLRLTAALEQAVGDAGDNVPVVAHRADRQPWIVSCRLDDLPRLAVQIYLTMAEHA